MADITPHDGGEAIRVVLDADLRERFEDWRRRQPRIPSLSEGARQLLRASLAADHAAA